MKSLIAGLAGALALSNSVYAQSSAAEPSGYVAVVAQSAFGEVTSQSFGVEGGWYLQPRLMVIAEAGAVRDTAHEAIGPAAQIIAVYLGQVQSQTVSYSVRQPVGFFQIGGKYSVPFRERFNAYVLAEGGVARVKRDVRFTVGSTDVTDTLDTYGVVLGTDLAGTTSAFMATGGIGVTWQAKEQLFFDAGYRFSRISSKPDALGVNRVGLGIGFTF